MEIRIETQNLKLFKDDYSMVINEITQNQNHFYFEEENVVHGDGDIDLIAAIVFLLQSASSGIIGNYAWGQIKSISQKILNNRKPNHKLQIIIEAPQRKGPPIREYINYEGADETFQISLPSGSKIKISK